VQRMSTVPSWAGGFPLEAKIAVPPLPIHNTDAV
jgi:hypothetical protein